VPIIINGGSRSGGAWWSKHLDDDETNEQVEVMEYRDLSAGTMREAFVRALWPGLAYSPANLCDGGDQNGGNR
jgi:hypothetical protein